MGKKGGAVIKNIGAVGQGTLDELSGKAAQRQAAQAQALADQQAQAQRDLLKQQQDQELAKAEEEKALAADAQAGEAAVDQRRRQKLQAKEAGGRRGTILTGPLGVQEQAPTAGKTLLGA